MRNELFRQAWENLSEIQRQAAEWERGSMLLLAGPGSGKTRVLTCRIARLLEASVGKNFRVLGLTFTNKAANEMKERLEKYVPGTSATSLPGNVSFILCGRPAPARHACRYPGQTSRFSRFEATF